MDTWEGKLQTPPPFIFAQLYMLSTTSHIMGYHCGQLGSVFPAVLHPSSSCTPSLLDGGVGEEAEQATVQALLKDS